MLNFIIMGEVPGTHIQITFYGLLLGLLLCALLIAFIILIRGLTQLTRKHQPTDINTISM